MNYYLNQLEEHNKFYITDKTNNTVTLRWGRLGVEGQTQTKHFQSDYEAQRFLSTKTNEKLRKGYKKTDKNTFERLSIEAAIVGTTNKIINLDFFDHKIHNNTIEVKTVTQSELNSPDCNPCIIVTIETRKAYNNENNFILAFTPTGTYKLHKLATLSVKSNFNLDPVTPQHFLSELTSKIEAALGASFGKQG